MTAVAPLQAELAELLTRRRAVDTDPTVREQCSRLAGGNDRLSPAEQIEIYREQFWLRHTSCLLEDFEALASILGQSDWERLIEDYLAAHPPTSYNLRDLGERLSAFVERASWLPHHALCTDMARVEWAYIEVFDAADAAPLDPERLASVPEAAWEHARLVLNPALRLLRVRHPVAALRRSFRLKQPDIVLPEAQPENLVIYRGQDRDLHHRVLGDDAFSLLDALSQGLPLVRAAEIAVARAPDRAESIERDLTGWFADFAAQAWIVGVEI
ncbi:MAG: putative DNA-binding domain-containing protein [Polyangiaceae bacterium]|nr:putative DNA-binding domain-containing protein [Polyangiaceae bacterium]